MKKNFYFSTDFSDYLFDFNTGLLWATGQNNFGQDGQEKKCQ